MSWIHGAIPLGRFTYDTNVTIAVETKSFTQTLVVPQVWEANKDTTGAKSCGTGANVDNAGAPAWNNPTNIYTSNNLTTSCALTGDGTSGAEVSDYLRATNFGFNVPTGAQILGVIVKIERSATSNSSAFDVEVYLWDGSAKVGVNKADKATTWTTTDVIATYGSATDYWGATLTPAIVNSSSFGVQIVAANGNTTARTLTIDHVTMEIVYSNPQAVIVETKQFVQTFDPPVSADTGWVNPSSIYTESWGGAAWSNTNNVLTSDNTYATATTATFDWTDPLVARFSITDARARSISDIQIKTERYTSNGQSEMVRLYYDQFISSASYQFSGGIPPSSESTTTYYSADGTGAFDYGPGVWGGVDTDVDNIYERDIAVSDVFGNQYFGALFQYIIGAGSGGTAYVDNAQCRVYYTRDDLVINAKTNIAVDTKTFTQTFPTVTIVEGGGAVIVSVDTKTFTQTFPAVTINAQTRIDVDTKTFTQTLYDANINERIPVSTKAFTQSFPTVTINAKEVIPVTTKTFAQTLIACSVLQGSAVSVDTKTFTQTFYAVDVFQDEIIPVTTKVFTQTFIPCSLLTGDVISVDTKVFTQTLHDATIIATDAPTEQAKPPVQGWSIIQYVSPTTKKKRKLKRLITKLDNLDEPALETLKLEVKAAIEQVIRDKPVYKDQAIAKLEDLSVDVDFRLAQIHAALVRNEQQRIETERINRERQAQIAHQQQIERELKELDDIMFVMMSLIT